MLIPIKNRQKLQDLERLASLKNQAEDFQFKDKLVKQNFHEKKKVVEPAFGTNKNTSETLTKTILWRKFLLKTIKHQRI